MGAEGRLKSRRCRSSTTRRAQREHWFSAADSRRDHLRLQEPSVAPVGFTRLPCPPVLGRDQLRPATGPEESRRGDCETFRSERAPLPPVNDLRSSCRTTRRLTCRRQAARTGARARRRGSETTGRRFGGPRAVGLPARRSSGRPRAASVWCGRSVRRSPRPEFYPRYSAQVDQRVACMGVPL